MKIRHLAKPGPFPLRPGLVRDEIEHCTTCGGTREEHDAVKWAHTWLPRRYVREQTDD